MSYSHEYYLKHRDEFNERSIAYYWEHREFILAKRKLKREKVREYNRLYWLKHKNDPPKPPRVTKPPKPEKNAPWQIREYFDE